MSSAGADARARRRRALAVLLVSLSAAWAVLAVAQAARQHVVAHGFRPLGAMFGDDVLVWRRGLPRAAANLLAGAPRIGLQVGHLLAAEQPDELAELRYSTGAHWDGIDEVEVNLAVAEALAARLRERGMTVDLLPATVPRRYAADVFVSVHVDANPDERRSGYKSAHFVPARDPREPLLKLHVDRAVLGATGLADDDRNVTGNMLRYYAFNSGRYRHAVSPRTPSLIVELGYLTNPEDAELHARPDRLAAALEGGIVSYLGAVGRIQAP